MEYETDHNPGWAQYFSPDELEMFWILTHSEIIIPIGMEHYKLPRGYPSYPGARVVLTDYPSGERPNSLRQQDRHLLSMQCISLLIFIALFSQLIHTLWLYLVPRVQDQTTILAGTQHFSPDELEVFYLDPSYEI